MNFFIEILLRYRLLILEWPGMAVLGNKTYGLQDQKNNGLLVALYIRVSVKRSYLKNNNGEKCVISIIG